MEFIDSDRGQSQRAHGGPVQALLDWVGLPAYVSEPLFPISTVWSDDFCLLVDVGQGVIFIISETDFLWKSNRLLIFLRFTLSCSERNILHLLGMKSIQELLNLVRLALHLDLLDPQDS